jgi:hypothetical protein
VPDNPVILANADVVPEDMTTSGVAKNIREFTSSTGEKLYVNIEELTEHFDDLKNYLREKYTQKAPEIIEELERWKTTLQENVSPETLKATAWGAGIGGTVGALTGSKPETWQERVADSSSSPYPYR